MRIGSLVNSLPVNLDRMRQGWAAAAIAVNAALTEFTRQLRMAVLWNRALARIEWQDRRRKEFRRKWMDQYKGTSKHDGSIEWTHAER